MIFIFINFLVLNNPSILESSILVSCLQLIIIIMNKSKGIFVMELVSMLLLLVESHPFSISIQIMTIDPSS